MEEILASIRRIIADDQPRVSEPQGATANSGQANSGEAKSGQANSGEAPASVFAGPEPVSAGSQSGQSHDEPVRLRGMDESPTEGGAALHVLRPEGAPSQSNKLSDAIAGAVPPAEPSVPNGTRDADAPAATTRAPERGLIPSTMDAPRARPDMASHGAIGTPQFAAPDSPPQRVPQAPHPAPPAPPSDARQVASAPARPPVAGSAADAPVAAANRPTPSQTPRPTPHAQLPHSQPPQAAAPQAPVRPPQAPAAQAQARPAQPPRPGAPAAAGLISSATDQSVASAFNMLAASRLADNSDELIGLAREMIRPMLRAWLDDNLPPMVERMVRAEIERVARGGR